MGEIEEIIEKTVDMQSFPSVAAKVLQLTSNEFTSVEKLEEIISKDQSLSSKILRIANSPYYGRGRSVDKVSLAIILIGFSTLKSLVVTASLKDMHRKFGLLEQKLWEHELGVSVAASILADETKLAEKEEALTAGLLHDIGKSVINNSLPEKYSAVVENVYEQGLSFVEVEDDLLGFNHCNVGGLVARKWKLPKSLEMVIEYHHSESLPEESSDFEALCDIVKAADTICLNLGIGLRKPEEMLPIDTERLGISESMLKKIEEKIKKTYAEQKACIL